ncbi:hypothetical protein SAMN05421805_104167 [Saccharopolyspora antimicrobica]|uniref:Uncharacterized protein n=1 Tax=Saccharopolyspora antimicrobica TaxID=455193 RepID=A0A1I4YJ56_9PSEU|nr:DUF6236 family protein [Saccharopolyspora antimicrobica]RKT82696.1 hypothetical protein ATL45_0951 [Saccharopolyspora antimicrobica]SFN38027.1 hypothetical protein SAMN05421805_104167 [Saccharopolyspora antimicrobica]
MVDPIALYYPYIHVRDDTWLKYAALYWPKMGRLRPASYPVRDSAVAEVLRREMGWLVDVLPNRAAISVQRRFLQFVGEYAAELRERFGLDKSARWPPRPASSFMNTSSVHGGATSAGSVGVWPGRGGPSAAESRSELDPRLGYIHLSKTEPQVVDNLIEEGLAVEAPGRGGRWLGMHPELANVYMCVLAEQVASQNHLHPVTDQVLPHAAVSGWTVERIAAALLGDHRISRSEREPGDPLGAFVLTAFETVVPANLASVPVGKIVEIRQKFGVELDAFREYVTGQVEQMSGIEDVQDFTLFQEHIHNEVQRTVAKQLDDLRERLRSIGLESVRALANIKTFALPPLAATAAQFAGINPAITGSAAVATCLASVPVQARNERRQAMRESPVGYLFRVGQEFDPATLANRVRKLIRQR